MTPAPIPPLVRCRPRTLLLIAACVLISGLITVCPAAAAITQLTFSQSREPLGPQISGDGRVVAFYSSDILLPGGPGGQQLFFVRADGTDLRQLHPPNAPCCCFQGGESVGPASLDLTGSYIATLVEWCNGADFGVLPVVLDVATNDLHTSFPAHTEI